jgi:hypothetical protein
MIESHQNHDDTANHIDRFDADALARNGFCHHRHPALWCNQNNSPKNDRLERGARMPIRPNPSHCLQ